MIIILLYQLFVLLLHSIAVFIFDKDDVTRKKISRSKTRDAILPPLVAAAQECDATVA